MPRPIAIIVARVGELCRTWRRRAVLRPAIEARQRLAIERRRLAALLEPVEPLDEDAREFLRRRGFDPVEPDPHPLRPGNWPRPGGH